MRLCNIHDGFFAAENGKVYCNVINYRLFQRFLKHFEKINVVARIGSRTENLVELDLPGVEVHLVNSIVTPIAYLKYSRSVKETIHRCIEDCDVVYSTVGPMGEIARRNSKLAGKKIIAFVGGCVFDSLRSIGTIGKRSVANYAFKKAREFIMDADYVIYVATYLKERYPTKGKSCIWSDVQICRGSEEERTLRMDLITNPGRQTKIGLIGYVHNKVKGVDTAIKALALLNNRFHLEILGGGEHAWADNIAEKLSISERVKFHGIVQGGAPVLKWLDNIDVYIQPSRTEGLPKATLEAMSRGCPVISSNVGGLPDLVMREWLHKPGDYQTLAQLIQQLSSNKHNMLVSSDHSYSVVSRYSKVKLDEIFDDFIDQITRDLR